MILASIIMAASAVSAVASEPTRLTAHGLTASVRFKATPTQAMNRTVERAPSWPRSEAAVTVHLTGGARSIDTWAKPQLVRLKGPVSRQFVNLRVLMRAAGDAEDSHFVVTGAVVGPSSDVRTTGTNIALPVGEHAALWLHVVVDPKSGRITVGFRNPAKPSKDFVQT